MSKKHNVKKTRYNEVIISSKDIISGITYNDETGQVEILKADGNIYNSEFVSSGSYYEKESGKKKWINRISDAAIISEEKLCSYLTQNFDMAFVIDTNTQIIKSDKISVSSIYLAYFKKINKNNSINIKFRFNGIFIYKNCPNDSAMAEKAGWLKLVENIKRDPKYNAKNIALITDHDIKKHTKINRRETPLFLDEYLPTNIIIMYAGSDTPNDSILNNLINKCDKEAKSILNSLKENSYCYFYGNKISLLDDVPECGDKYKCTSYFLD